MFPDGVRQCALAGGDFFADFRARFEDEQRMTEAVVSHYMSGADDFADDIGPLLNIASYQKESRSNFMPCQNFQQPERVRIVRPIIIGQRELLRTSA